MVLFNLIKGWIRAITIQGIHKTDKLLHNISLAHNFTSQDQKTLLYRIQRDTRFEYASGKQSCKKRLYVFVQKELQGGGASLV
jgi:hypothetical protein